jgi:predicted secreted hydrolase
LNGDAGFSQKSAQGQASYYYSQPNITVKGTVKTEDKTVPLSGNAWLDREWSSQALAQNQKGWDWFSLHLDDGNKLMVYQLRHDTGDEWVSGSWINENGEVTPLYNDDIELNSNSERQITTKNNRSITLPLDWKINLTRSDLSKPNLSILNRSLTIKPLYDEQWLATSFPYWEGVVIVSDDKGQNIGKGYMELTGYQAEQ